LYWLLLSWVAQIGMVGSVFAVQQLLFLQTVLLAFCRHLEGIFFKTNLHAFVWHLNLHCYVNVMGIFMCVLFVFWGIL